MEWSLGLNHSGNLVECVWFDSVSPGDGHTFSFVVVFCVICHKKELPQGKAAGVSPMNLVFEPASQTGEFTVIMRLASV